MSSSLPHKVTIYTWTVCPYCVRAKELLKRKAIAFNEINLDGKDDELENLRKKTQWKTIPQIFIGDEFIGGYTDLAQLDAQGELDKKIGRIDSK
ncbi:MAG: glutaredoxin 3 [Bdellovibrionales bacterium]|nr:glutaredoxin 3 [Bdellovibrionales bacterium]